MFTRRLKQIHAPRLNARVETPSLQTSQPGPLRPFESVRYSGRIRTDALRVEVTRCLLLLVGGLHNGGLHFDSRAAVTVLLVSEPDRAVTCVHDGVSAS